MSLSLISTVYSVSESEDESEIAPKWSEEKAKIEVKREITPQPLPLILKLEENAIQDDPLPEKGIPDVDSGDQRPSSSSVTTPEIAEGVEEEDEVFEEDEKVYSELTPDKKKKRKSRRHKIIQRSDSPDVSWIWGDVKKHRHRRPSTERTPMEPVENVPNFVLKSSRLNFLPDLTVKNEDQKITASSPTKLSVFRSHSPVLNSQNAVQKSPMKPCSEQVNEETVEVTPPTEPLEEVLFKCPLCVFQSPVGNDLILHFRNHEQTAHLACIPKPIEEVSIVNESKSEDKSVPKPRPRGRPSKKTSTVRSTSKPDLETAKNGIADRKMWTCTVCTKSFRTTYRNTHMRVHANDKPFRCSDCPKRFLVLSNLKVHVKRWHPKENKRKVRNQEKPLPKRVSLRRRSSQTVAPTASDKITKTSNAEVVSAVETVPRVPVEPIPKLPKRKDKVKSFGSKGRKAIRKCKVCGKISYNIHLHMKTHRQDFPFGCGICSDRFQSCEEMKAHINVHSESNSNSPSSFTFKGKAEKEVTFRPCSINLIRCVNIEAFGKLVKTKVVKSKDKGRRSTSANSSVSAQKKFQCKKCNKFLSTGQALEVHSRIHTGIKPFKCSECPKTFYQNGALRLHLRTHSGDKPFECSKCSKSFACNQSLKLHLLTHSEEKAKECSKVTKLFNQSGDLSKHSNGKLFKCSKCPKTFTQTGNFKAHLLTHSKPFKCSMCPKSFSQKNRLQIHLRTHTGEKPFKCPHCPFRTHCSDSMRTHVKYVHKDKQ